MTQRSRRFVCLDLDPLATLTELRRRSVDFFGLGPRDRGKDEFETALAEGAVYR